MPNWFLALLLKPFLGIIQLAVVFGTPILLVKLLRPLFPEGRLKDVLFREYGDSQGTSPTPDLRQHVLNDVPLIHGERVEDSTRL